MAKIELLCETEHFVALANPLSHHNRDISLQNLTEVCKTDLLKCIYLRFIFVNFIKY